MPRYGGGALNIRKGCAHRGVVLCVRFEQRSNRQMHVLAEELGQQPKIRRAERLVRSIFRSGGRSIHKRHAPLRG